MAAQKIEALAGIKFNSDLYAQCEYNRCCRMCLRKDKPRHMHVDVLEAFDEELVADVFKKQEEFREKLCRAEDSRQKLSDQFLEVVMALVDNHEEPFMKKAFCEMHLKECKIMPRGARRKRRALWIVDGTHLSDLYKLEPAKQDASWVAGRETGPVDHVHESLCI